MKFKIALSLLAAGTLLSCKDQIKTANSTILPIEGTWQLVSGTTITKGEHVFTDYTKDAQMIKIINKSHFAFLKHDVKPAAGGKNNFDAGGGRYILNGNQYTEHLDYYNDKNWEGKTFTFTVKIKNDTLSQSGIEKVEGAGIDREIIEKYVRVKDSAY